MLYDPKWDKLLPRVSPVKHPPLTVEALIAWLEQHPATKTYEPTKIDRCLLTQYLDASGFKNVLSLTNGEMRHCVGFWPFQRMANGRYPEEFDEIAWKHMGDNTFGAALERARAVLASQSR